MNKRIKVESPGRINLIGEHVDYNGGAVLPGAIDKKIEFIIENIPGKKCFIESKTINKKFEFELTSIEKTKYQWQNYILGTELGTKGPEFNVFEKIGLGIASGALKIPEAIAELGAGFIDYALDTNLVSALEKNFPTGPLPETSMFFSSVKYASPEAP